ncbi:Zinc finger MYM-type protein 1 [Linum grandiflorum]
MRPASHIDKVIDKISREEVLKHRLRLKASRVVVERLALQGGAFTGHDESNTSLNRGNFIEWVNFLSQWNDEVKKVVLGNALGNAKYVSPLIQKELLAIMGNKVRKKIREEVGDACFAILVDEAQDESGHEQMTIILRFVNSKGILTEHFLTIKGVAKTSSETLYQVICDVLAQYDLPIRKMCGQEYDGASNMSGQFNGLKALFLKDCPYAYFVHCFAHILQLALMTAAKYFNQTIDFQLSELKLRFSENSVRLLQLIAALDPISSFRSFSENDIPELAENFYPQDFDACDRHTLRSELPFYSTQVVQNLEFHVPTPCRVDGKVSRNWNGCVL